MSETEPCAWCGKPSVTSVITRPGRKLRRTAPVCEKHAKKFEDDGVMTTRLEVDKKMEAERKRGTWLRSNRRWR